MRITQLETNLLRLPLARPITAANASDRAARLDYIFMLIVHIDTDASGKATFRFTTNGRIAPGHTITATATDDGAETSEVSNSVRVRARR